jgi:replicative DNA helicase
MERQEAIKQLKGQLRAYVESITQKSKGANMYVCPLCGSGTGRHKTGAFSIKTAQAGSALAVMRAGTFSTL